MSTGKSLGFCREGGVGIFPLEKVHYPLCRDLMRCYKDLPMDLADATLVALAETLGVSRVFTLDHKDFSIYRFKHTRRFTLIPPNPPFIKGGEGGISGWGVV